MVKINIADIRQDNDTTKTYFAQTNFSSKRAI